jgi:hypothetical protein
LSGNASGTDAWPSAFVSTLGLNSASASKFERIAIGDVSSPPLPPLAAPLRFACLDSRTTGDGGGAGAWGAAMSASSRALLSPPPPPGAPPRRAPVAVVRLVSVASSTCARR